MSMTFSSLDVEEVGIFSPKNLPLKKDDFLRALLDPHVYGGIPPALVVVSVPLVFYNPTTDL